MRAGTGPAAGRSAGAAPPRAGPRLAAVPPAARGAPAPPDAAASAQDLKAALDEVRRRLEEQRRAAGEAPAGDPAGELAATRDRIEGLARAMGRLRAERGDLRAQLLQTRDELAKAQQRQ